MILDDGGDATMMVLRGAEWEAAGAVVPATDADPAEWHSFTGQLAKSLEENKGNNKWQNIAAAIKGVTEETTTGVHASVPDAEGRQAAVPGDERQ